MTGRLEGRTVIVTGASKGIGAAAVTALLAEGAAVVGTARDVSGMAAGDRCRPVAHDVASEDGWAAVIKAAETLGPVYGVVNNAGAFTLKPLADTSEAEFDQLYRTNVEGTWLGLKHGFAAIQRSGRPGAIVNVSSLMGQVGVADGIAYCATKGAVTGMTKAAAIDGAALNPRIRVNSLHPGVIWTPMLTSIFGEDEAGGAMFAADTPLRRLGKPQDIAEAIVFLLSDDSAYMTGAELTVDGGRGAD
jgi:NAD(P)-dependent dehydrogenase (short-subunit alcohol dehydrogenase family)